MNILLVNKFHYQRDGVTTHYFALAKLLKAHGHKVAFFSTRHPKNRKTRWSKYFVSYKNFVQEKGLLSNVKTFFSTIYNVEAKRRMRALLKDFKPDIVHLHNIYYHITPSIIDEISHQGIPMVMTLHDYKLISPSYTLFLGGQIWDRSRPHKFYRAVIDRAIKHSYLKSLAAALEQYIHFWRNIYAKVDIFISPSAFLKKIFAEYQFKGQISVIANPIFLKNKGTMSNTPGEYFLYYGRLAPEKGVLVILNALVQYKDFRLMIAGRGPQEKILKTFAKKHGLEHRVRFVGFKKGKALLHIIRASKAVIVPSLWYENFPYTVLESLAMGKLVIASSIGGIPELITNEKNGLLFAPGDIGALHTALLKAQQLPPDPLAFQAKQSVLRYDPEQFYNQLLLLYKKVLKSLVKNEEKAC